MSDLVFYMCKGLPASGKSSWASQYVLSQAPGKAVRVNQDLLRIMLNADRFAGQKTESLVTTARDTLIETAMRRAVPTIISDDTNFNPACAEKFRALCQRFGYEFHVKDFTDVPVETCIKRDLKRQASVGEAVIRKMYQKYLAPQPVSIVREYDSSLPTAVMVDIDGTVALMDGRSPYDGSLCHTDKPNWPVIQLVRSLYDAGNHIIYCSGRDDTYWDVTKSWLEEYVARPVDNLFMRYADDKRKDSIIKRELFEKNIEGKWNIRFVLDDRNQVVDMWRSIGLPCFQVAPGDF